MIDRFVGTHERTAPALDQAAPGSLPGAATTKTTGHDAGGEHAAASTPADTAEAPPAEPTPFAVTITRAGKQVKMTAPETTPAGLTELQLKGDHGVQLVRVAGDRTLAEPPRASRADLRRWTSTRASARPSSRAARGRSSISS